LLLDCPRPQISRGSFKKNTNKKHKGNNMGAGKIIQIVTVVVALVAGVMGGFPQSALAIAVLGLVSGYFIEADDRMRFLVGALAITAFSGGLNAIPAVGPYISAALGTNGLAAAYAAGAVSVIVLALVDKLKP